MKPIVWLACFGLGLLATGAQAGVYHCVVNGQNVYTNKPGGNCQTAKLDKIGSYTSDQSIIRRQNEMSDASIAAQSPQPAQAQAAKPRNTGNAAPAAAQHAHATSPVARPAAAPQTPREQGRREILTTELNNEKKALAQARLALSNGRLILNANDERKQQNMASLQRAVDDRTQNVQALQNELSRM